MAADLAAMPRTGLAGAALRRRAPVELRRLRRARPAAGLRRQRLRRDAARPVRVGRQASRRRASRSRAATAASSDKQRSGRSTWRWRAPTARRCAGSPACATSTSGTRASTSRSSLQRWAARCERASSVKRFERNVAKARAKDSLRAFGEADRDRRRRAADRQRPAADRPDRRARRRPSDAHEIEDVMRDVIRSYRRTLPDDRRQPARALPLRRRRAQGRRRRQRRHARVDRADARPRRRATRCSCSSRRREASVLEPFLGKSEFANHGQRVVEGQRLMQAASDILLGWIRTDGHRRRQARLLRPPALGREGLGDRRVDGPERAERLRRALRLDAGARARPLRATRSRSPATSAAATPSTARWRASPRPTPTRTSATTTRSPTRSRAAASKPSRASSDAWPRLRPGQAVSNRCPGRAPERRRRYASAFCLIASNSAWLMAPLSSSFLARSISPAAPPSPAAARTWSSNCCLLASRALQIALGHAVVLRDQVDEDAQERQHDRENKPARLPES